MEFDLKQKFDSYPENIKPIMLGLRELIFTIAKEQNLGEVNESLKWGEPSYQVKSGSPIRIDWKAKTPENYYIFFHCQTKLVDTFRELYSDALRFEGNRAIILDVTNPGPDQVIRKCITMAMTYKRIKHLPLLGAR